jgi:hypothetical protein
MTPTAHLSVAALDGNRRATFVAMMLLYLPSCTSPVADAGAQSRFVAALHALPDADAAMDLCITLDETLRSDCVVATVEAAPRHPSAPSWCAALSGIPAYECHFQLAERRHDLAACRAAGPFEDDCRLHIFSASLDEVWPADLTFAEGVTRVRAHLGTTGLPEADVRFWSAAFRHGLLLRRPFDRRACEALPEPELSDACRHTAVAVYHDLLNHERDFGRFPCDDGPLPPSLAHTEDDELDAIIAERRTADLCRKGR